MSINVQPAPPRADMDQLPPWLTFDQFGRYSLIREILQAARPLLGGERLKILDVGGLFTTSQGEHVLPIRTFLPDDTIVVLDQSTCPLPDYQQGDGRSLDFADRAFDFVVTADTLEHVPAADRAAFLDELTRVARYGVVLLAPFRQPIVEDAEALARDYIRAETGLEQPQLAEHYAYGLPEVTMVREHLAAQGLAHMLYPSGYVHSWLAMMIAKHYLFGIAPYATELHMRLEHFYIRWLAHDERREPGYRQCFVIAIDQPQPWLEAVNQAVAPTIQQAQDHVPWAEMVPWLLHGIQLHHTQRLVTPEPAAGLLQERIAQLEALGWQRDAQLLELHTLLAERDARLADTQNQLIERDARLTDIRAQALWHAEQAAALHTELRAVQAGRVMRLLRLLAKD